MSTTRRGKTSKSEEEEPEEEFEEEEEEEKAPPKKKAKTKKNDGPIARSATPRRQVAATGTYKILSVNVAGLRATLNPEKGKAALFRSVVEQEDPDLLLLNEHKLKEEDVEGVEEILDALLPAYAHRRFACSTAKKGYSGVAALSKLPLSVAAEDFPGNAFPDEGRFLHLTLPSPSGVSVFAVYVPNSGQQLDRLEARVKPGGWDRSLERYAASVDGSVLVIGDLNVAHGVSDIHNFYARPNFDDLLAEDNATDAESYEPQYKGLTAIKKQAGLTAKERASFTALLEGAGVVDSFRHFHPSAHGCFSYYSQRAVQNRPANKGLRLDYVLASNALLSSSSSSSGDDDGKDPALLDSFILDKDPAFSDHVPVGCVLRLPSSSSSS